MMFVCLVFIFRAHTFLSSYSSTWSPWWYLVEIAKEEALCVISGFRRDVDEICVLLRCYAAYSGNSLLTFRDILSVPDPIFKGQEIQDAFCCVFFSSRFVNQSSIYTRVYIYIYIKVKVRWSRYRPGVAQRVGRGISLLFHDRGTRRGWVVSSTPRPHLSPGKSRYPFYRRLGGPQDRSGQVQKISPPPRFDPRTVQPVASRYTDYATRPTIYYMLDIYIYIYGVGNMQENHDSLLK